MTRLKYCSVLLNPSSNLFALNTIEKKSEMRKNCGHHGLFQLIEKVVQFTRIVKATGRKLIMCLRKLVYRE